MMKKENSYVLSVALDNTTNNDALLQTQCVFFGCYNLVFKHLRA